MHANLNVKLKPSFYLLCWSALGNSADAHRCVFQVVEQNGQWYCEYDGKTYPSMVRRYVTTIRCTDNTAELTLNAFNEQVICSSPILQLHHGNAV